jgi:hypothetical protein
MLVANGLDVTGFDPAYEGTSPRVIKDLFGPQHGIRAHGVVLRHVLEHLKDPAAFLMQLRDANLGTGTIYIEVPCFDWICERRAWFDIFYEHVNYFRLSDFRRLFGVVHDEGRLFGDQYLYVVADLSTVRGPCADPADRPSVPPDFLRSLTAHSSGVGTDIPSAIWGGASKGVVFALRREDTGLPVATVIDINPAKQGRFLPATGLLVESPAQALAHLPPGATIFVMNSNYLAEIQDMSHHRYTYVVLDHE